MKYFKRITLLVFCAFFLGHINAQHPSLTSEDITNPLFAEFTDEGGQNGFLFPYSGNLSRVTSVTFEVRSCLCCQTESYAFYTIGMKKDPANDQKFVLIFDPSSRIKFEDNSDNILIDGKQAYRMTADSQELVERIY